MDELSAPLKAAADAALGMENPLARSALLGEVAKSQARLGFWDDVFESATKIPNRAEKRGVLRDLALGCIESGGIEPLPRLLKAMVETDPASGPVVGRLAMSLMDGDAPGADRIRMALELLRLTSKPFESRRGVYDFLERLLAVGGEAFEEQARVILALLTDADFQDWGQLALMKSLARWTRWKEAEEIARKFTQPRRRSWAFLDLARSPDATDEDRIHSCFGKSEEFLDEIEYDENADQRGVESLAAQYRILGKAAFTAGLTEAGSRILERAEAVAAMITSDLQRLKMQYFLARTLRELGLIDSVGNYLDKKSIRDAGLTGIDRSRVFQWSAEVGDLAGPRAGLSDWTEAVRQAAEKQAAPNRFGDDEFNRAQRIAEIVRRFSMRNEKFEPTGDPDLDAVRLPGAEFEEHYYSPFAIDDCGC